jgi:hypothetical protein
VTAVALSAGALVAPVALGSSGPGENRVSVVPRIGIGVVRLNETAADVSRALGPGAPVRHGVYAGDVAYRVGSITIDVGYGNGRVDGVNTNSTGVLIYGYRLADGLAALESLFRAHGWTTLSCRGETFTQLGQGGPGTGIAWRAGILDDVQIDAGGSIGDQCGPLPSSAPANDSEPQWLRFIWLVPAMLSVVIAILRRSAGTDVAAGTVDPDTGRLLPDKALIPELLRVRRERHDKHADGSPD